MIASNIFDGLIYRGEDLKMDKTKGLATGWKYQPNRRALLAAQGVTFQDGEPFNADAVKFTFDRSLARSVRRGAHSTSSTKRSRKSRVDDPYTVDIITSVPNPVMIASSRAMAP